MAAIVVFCTTYALILPAITWEHRLLCDTKEHTHTASCYAEVVVTPEQRELTCSIAEHVHGDSCYEEVTTCVCGLEEGETHQHTADCMKTERVLTCEQSEHTHDDSCFQIIPAVTQRELICNKPEHVHTDACYDAPPSSDSGYYCGYAEHKHNDSCRFEDGSLRCTMKEHTHTLSCKIDKTADLETADGWERTFADVKLGDNWAENVLAIADTQLGYTESDKNFVIDDENTGSVRGYSRYGAWYGDPYGDWCAMFASFCIDYAGVKNFPLDSNCGTWITALSDKDCLLYHPVGSYFDSYIPRPGDLIFFDWDAQKQVKAAEDTAESLTDAQPAEAEAKLIEQATHDVDHVGLVYELIEATDTKPAQIKTIEGNNGNTVAYHTYDLDDVRLLGYGQLPENPDFLKFQEITSDPASDGATVTIGGNLPKDAKATIEPVKLSENELNTYIGEETASAINSYIAYDIKIMVGETEWQPDDSVSVQIKHPNLEVKNSDCLAAAHVNDVTHTASEVEKPVGTDDAISFTTGGFSTYIFYTFTVDFHYGEAVFSIEGRTEITLSELFAELGITRSVADVVEVTFSDESLVKVTKTENDWLLTSLEPFSTNETLTIVFNDGEVYVLSVTDAQADWGWQKATSIAAGDLVIVQLNSNNNFYLTNETMSNNNGLVLENTGINDATIWTVVDDNNNLRLRSDKDNRRGDIVIEQSKAYLGSGNRAIPSYDSANNYWVLARDNIYLNQFNGGTSTRAAGYGANDSNSRWNILKLTPANLIGISGTQGNTNEGYGNLFDNVQSTKYCVNPSNNKVTVTFKTASGNPLTANAYSLATANDSATTGGRLPTGWTLFGSNDNNNWTQISKITNPGMNAVNYTGYAYGIDSPKAYTYYKIEFNTADLIQFSDLKLYGAEAATNGTVRNGTGSNTTYTFDVYVQQVDSFNNPLGVPVKIDTQTADSTRTKNNNPIVPSALFADSHINGTYVNAYYGTASTKDQDKVTKVYWYHRDGGSNYNLGVTANGTDINNYLNASSDKALYIQYRVDSGGGGGDDDADKPAYPAYLPTSPQKTGEAQIGKVEGTYWSDAATSQLESQFNGVRADDGKVLTDKSVIYKSDDYGAFTSYADNTFGVTLSALGQKYPITEEFDIRVPLDVVFVLDTSGSMIDTKYSINGQNVTSANIMIESLNKIMANILEQNEDNRVGVVCFSGQSTKLLDLGRYTATDNKFFDEGKCDTKDYKLTPSNSIRRTDGTLDAGTFKAGWWGTYTQHGIAQGAKEFLDNTDTTVTHTITKQTDDGTATATYTATRRPIIILLSDGEPTYCTEDYTSVLASTNVRGDGTATTATNNQGIMGYYTILSAQYYKKAITAHYHTDAYFYTIGIGINDTGNNSFANSVAGDDYKRAVLNPTVANVSHLQTCTGGKNQGDNNKDISGTTDTTCRELYRLLNDNQTGPITVGSHNATDSARYGLPVTTTSNSAPVIENPYKNSGYSYADGSFFSANSSVEKLTEAFTKAISFSENIPVYGYILKNNSPVTASDPIGEGMEVKSDLVLRYGGQNYTPDHSETKGNVTTYYYKGEYKATDGSGTVVDINKITAQVVKNADGTQTVKLFVPDAQLPAYSPYLKNDGAAKFYYEELPVRLIYQVGLTEQAQKDVAALGDTGGTKTYYTNQWKDTTYADADYQPTSKNPYYNKDNYNKGTINKTENTTETASYSRKFSGNSTDKYVDQLLGNNGKLVFSYEVPPQKVTLYKVDMNGKKITTGTAEFKLYSDADLKTLVGTYTTRNGELTIPNLTAGQEYWLKETKAPDGYNRLEEAQKFKVDAKGDVTGIGTDNAYFQWSETDHALLFRNSNGYELPESGGSGLLPVYVSGILLMAGALTYGYSTRRKRERRQSI